MEGSSRSLCDSIEASDAQLMRPKVFLNVYELRPSTYSCSLYWLVGLQKSWNDLLGRVVESKRPGLRRVM